MQPLLKSSSKLRLAHFFGPPSWNHQPLSRDGGRSKNVEGTLIIYCLFLLSFLDQQKWGKREDMPPAVPQPPFPPIPSALLSLRRCSSHSHESIKVAVMCVKSVHHATLDGLSHSKPLQNRQPHRVSTRKFKLHETKLMQGSGHQLLPWYNLHFVLLKSMYGIDFYLMTVKYKFQN